MAGLHITGFKAAAIPTTILYATYRQVFLANSSFIWCTSLQCSPWRGRSYNISCRWFLNSQRHHRS